ncbi:MAG TPA: hypothetical protein VI544_00555 [Candidatus Nanoarchaeia archaeon]|nr:hypothetical protein [Candidatus Nanoarchaeia archaeon]
MAKKPKKSKKAVKGLEKTVKKIDPEILSEEEVEAEEHEEALDIELREEEDEIAVH